MVEQKETRVITEREKTVVKWLGIFAIVGLVVSAYTIQLEAAMLTAVSAFLVFCLMYAGPKKRGE